MPLSAANFVVKGPVKSADLLQFYNLFTGVMTDQPATFSNQVNIGGSQSNSTVPLRLFGAPGQTSHLIDLYPDHTSAQPGFGFSAVGTFGWGPGGTAPIDTTLSRIATQEGHASDTAGLLIAPELEVTGNILPHGSLLFPSGAAVADGGAAVVNLGTHAAVQTNLYIGLDRSAYLHEVRAGEIGLLSRLLINSADAEGVGLTYGVGYLQTRGADMPDVVNAYSFPLSAQVFSGNWLQFNPKFLKITAGVAWPGIALLLDYDVDANGGGPGGRISMLNAKVGIGPNIVSASGDPVQLMGNTTVNGILSVGGTASNTPAANIVFPQAVGPKICMYDAGSGAFFGFGISSAHMYACIPTGATFSIYNDNSSGALLLQVNQTGVVLGPAATSSTLWLGNDLGVNLVRSGAPGSATLALSGGGFTINGNFALAWNTPTDPQPGGNQQFRIIQPSTRSATAFGGGEVHIGIRLFCDGDITSGTNMHAVSFMTTSDPRLKTGMSVLTDANCMARIRAPSVPVYSYSIAPGVPGSVPTPNPVTIGFDATDVYANSPEFTALDQNSTPVSVIYGQMAALLWGALRNLDARCVAKGI